MPPVVFRHRLPAGFRASLAPVLVAVVALVPIAALGWTPTLEVGTEFNDNANYATREQKSATAAIASLDVSNLRGLSGDWQAGIGGQAQTSAWFNYPGLNLTEIGAHGLLRHKFGLGAYAPRIDLRAGVSRQFSRVGGWSGTRLRGSAALHRRFTPQWQASLAGEYDQLFARRAVYAITTRTAIARIDYDPVADWRVSVSLRYRVGEQLSWCRASWPPFVGTNLWLDGIFGGDWFPYKEGTHRVAGSLDLSHALGSKTTLALGYDTSDAHSEAGHIYLQHIFRLQLIHAF